MAEATSVAIFGDFCVRVGECYVSVGKEREGRKKMGGVVIERAVIG